MGAVPAFTKFVPPLLPPTLVRRPHLEAEFDRAVTDAPLTVITGSPGAGKTVLLSARAASDAGRRTLWLTCDRWENTRTGFWTSLVTALNALGPETGADALDLLDLDPLASQEPSALVASLVNDLGAVRTPVELILDDFHLVTPGVLADFAVFLERIPPTVRVIMASRVDPLLPLHRWRLDGRVRELRDANLRLDTGEIGALLGRFNVQLSEEDLDRVAQRTEGWPAGVQLLALNLRDVDQPAQFLQEFTGSERSIDDYLTAEVLDRQAAEVVDFLLTTSIVEDFDADLCRELSGRDDSYAILRSIEAAGLFLVPLDHERRQYRYHHLFGQLLRAELNRRDRTRLATLHQRAGAWYEQHDHFDRAVHHYITGGATGPALGVLQLRLTDAWFAGAGEQLNRLLQEIPAEAIVLGRQQMVDLALGLAVNGQNDAASAWLERVERVTSPDPDDPVGESRHAVTRCFIHAVRGELEQAIAGEADIDTGRPLPPDMGLTAALVLMRAHAWIGDPEGAWRHRTLGGESARNAVEEAALDSAAAGVAFEEGHLVRAEHLAQRVLRPSAAGHVSNHPSTFDSHYALAGLALERNALVEAEQHVEQALRLAETPRRPPFIVLASDMLARIWQAAGDTAGAAQVLQNAHQVLPGPASSALRQRLDATLAELSIEGRRLDQASILIDTLMPGVTRTLLQATLHVEHGEPEKALAALDDVQSTGLTIRLQLQLALLRARAHLLASQAPAASGHLDQAIELAVPHGYVRILVGRDARLGQLLTDRVVRLPRNEYSDQLLAAIDQMVSRTAARTDQTELLSPRELAIVPYLATRMTSRQIAGELYVSMNTLKTHLKSIYRKLDATSRTDAVSRARQLQIL